jgi:hypothetical protein
MKVSEDAIRMAHDTRWRYREVRAPSFYLWNSPQWRLSRRDLADHDILRPVDTATLPPRRGVNTLWMR